MNADTFRVVESGLLPVYASDDRRLVSARELHAALEIGWQFSDWIQDRIAKYGFVEGQEFFRVSCKTPAGGRPRIEYWLTLDCAKEIAMVENNERGRRIRRYLIEVEKRYRSGLALSAEQMLADPDFLVELAIRYRDERNARLAAEAKVAELTPKAEFHDRVAASNDAISIREAAKVLGTGQNRLFAWLRGQRILMHDNQPYQEYLDAGYFRVIEQTWEDRHGQPHISPKTLVTAKGLTWIQKRWDADNRPSDTASRRPQLSVVPSH
ncbi:phage antirepressor KilAC domain-containing protein [Symbiobacterium terraclitae]|uniref:phage antirepressor KilAC domain-containing protein n=1 Tax=Symbiobacterium terraclitae TaxID=557451 RepID=UPI0035B4FF6A